MLSDEHVLISLDARHAANILAGTKTVELRRRTMHVAQGATVWLYVKKPVGAIVGFAIAGQIHKATPGVIWQKFGRVSGLSKAEFLNYFDGVSVASVITLSSAQELRAPITLETLRVTVPSFQPPQFYCRLHKSSPVRQRLNKEP